MKEESLCFYLPLRWSPGPSLGTACCTQVCRERMATHDGERCVCSHCHAPHSPFSSCWGRVGIARWQLVHWAPMSKASPLRINPVSLVGNLEQGWLGLSTLCSSGHMRSQQRSSKGTLSIHASILGAPSPSTQPTARGKVGANTPLPWCCSGGMLAPTQALPVEKGTLHLASN